MDYQNKKYEYEESDIITPDYSGRRGQKTTISDVSIKKRVLLVCVYNKKGTLITHDIIYRLFMKYGEIYKILIFDKCKNWKIFVEMSSLENAEKAREGLNNYQLFEDGSKMTVYYAKVDQIVFQNTNSGGVDYRQLKLRKVNNFQSNGVNSSQNLSTDGFGGSPNLSGVQSDLPLTKQSLTNSSSRNSVAINNGPYSSSENAISTEKHRNNSFDYSELYRNFESVPNTRVSPQRGSVLGSLKKNSLFQTIQPVQICEGESGSVPLDLTNEGNAQNSSNTQNSANDISECDIDEGNQVNQLSSEFQQMNINNISDHSDIESGRNQDSSPQSQKNDDRFNTSGNNTNNELKSGNNTTFASSNNFNNENGSNPIIQPKISLLNPIQTNGSFPSTNNNLENGSSFNNQPSNLQFGGLSEFNKGFQINYDEYEDEEAVRKNQNPNLDETNRIQQLEGSDPSSNGRIAKPDSSTFIDPSNYVNPLYILENKKSRVIYVRGLEKKNLTTKKIYNLFSNFGNIELILYFTEKRYCLIQFESQEDATIAKEHLDSLKVETNQMRIFYSNYETIKQNQEGEKQCEIWKGEKNNFRFRYGKSISINPVTNTLHVSNLKAETCKQDVINEKFAIFGTICGFNRFTNANKYMCHVKFATNDEAINALTNLHEEEILGRKMHISFTRARISPQTTPDTQNSASLSSTNTSQPHNYSNFRHNSNQSNLINNNNNYTNTNQSPTIDSRRTNSNGIQSSNNSKNNNNNMQQQQKKISHYPSSEINYSVQNVLKGEDDEQYHNNFSNRQQQYSNFQYNQFQGGYSNSSKQHPYLNNNNNNNNNNNHNNRHAVNTFPYNNSMQYGIQNGPLPFVNGQEAHQHQNQFAQGNTFYSHYQNQPMNTVNMQNNGNFNLFK